MRARYALKASCVFPALWLSCSLLPAGPPEPGTHGHFAVLTAVPHQPPPLATVDFIYGPRETVGQEEWIWWQLQARKESEPNSTPLFQLRALTSRDPLASAGKEVHVRRYILRIGSTGETLEYRHARDGHAILREIAGYRRIVRVTDEER